MLNELIEHQYIFLLLLAIVANIYAKTTRNKILLYLLIIVFTLDIGLIFYEWLKENNLYSYIKIFFSSLYFGPLFYLYLLSVYDINVEKNHFLRHLAIPVILVVVLKILKFYFHFSPTERLPIISLGALIAFYYFFKGVKFIKVQTQTSSYIAKPRFITFYAIANIYILLSNAIFFISLLPYMGIDFLAKISASLSEFYYTYIMFPIWIIFVLLLSVYGITEASWLKKFIVKETLKFNTNIITDKVDELFKIISDDIVFQKRYLQSNLDIKTYSKIVDVSVEFIIAYVAHKNFKSFTHLLNFYRVEEFKKRIDSKGSSNYTLIGIATECGFKSKSTFFRVFKEFEGITPKMFADKIASNATLL